MRLRNRHHDVWNLITLKTNTMKNQYKDIIFLLATIVITREKFFFNFNYTHKT